jgi:hypothetical protein
MIELKEAVKIGKEFILDVYDKPEEVVLDSAKPSETNWLVRFRVPLNFKPINSLQNVLGVNKRIFYKTIKIDDGGKVIEIIDEAPPTGNANELQMQTA